MNLYIADAADILFSRWKLVDSVEDECDLPDYLSSPSFDWHEGTVVWAGKSWYAFNADHAVNISKGSDVMESINPVEEMSLLEFWNRNDNPMWLIQVACEYIAEQYVIDALSAMIKLTYPNMNPWRIEDAAVAVEAVKNNLDVRVELNRLTKTTDDSHAIQAVKDLCCGFLSKNFQYYINACGKIGDCMNVASAAYECSEVIRSKIPFREVVIGVVKNR